MDRFYHKKSNQLIYNQLSEDKKKTMAELELVKTKTMASSALCLFFRREIKITLYYNAGGVIILILLFIYI
jgi:hypothetical protein